MEGYKKDQEVAQEGRSETLTEAETMGAQPEKVSVEASKRDKICMKLMKYLVDENIGEELAQTWYRANANRSEWLKRQQDMLQEYDEFFNDIYEKSAEWNSAIHLPVAFTVGKTYHARMFSALMDLDPPFTTVARQAANVDRAHLIQELMRYTLKSWANEYMGIDDVVDRWLWDWVMSGVGVLKGRWHTKYSKYVDVVEKQVPQTHSQVNPDTGAIEYVTGMKVEEEEEVVVKQIFDGPMLERVAIEDLVIVGGEGDPQKADFVAQQQMLTASELWTLVDEGIFDKEAVEDLIAQGPRRETPDGTWDIKYERSLNAGNTAPQNNYAVDRYRVIEAYCKLDVYKSGITSDVIVWFNPETRRVLHCNYLYRYMPTGLVPFFKIDFYKRNGQEYGIGLVELLYSLSKEMDAMHNIRIDTGILTSLPFGFYRPSSSMSTEKLPIEPGAMVPLDNPGTDVFFPNLGNRTGFGMMEEQNLNSWIEKLTSISDLSLGLMGSQGAARTATGARALVGEANANLNIFVRRMNMGWKRALTYLFNLLQNNIKPGFQFRLLGDDGDAYWSQINDVDAIAGMFDFELEPNSANSNKSIQVETAQQVYQLSGNPIDLQLGIIGPEERFQAIKNLLLQMGVKDWSRYIRKPATIARKLSPEEVANRVLANINTPLDPSQDLEGIVAYIQHIFEHDELLGQFPEQQAIALHRKSQEAQALLGAIQQQQAQVANMQQQRTNQQMAQPGAQGGMSLTPPAAQPGPAGPQASGPGNPQAAG